MRNSRKAYVESMNWGMIASEVPRSRYPATRNKQPIACVALAAQKNAYPLYFHCATDGCEAERALSNTCQYAGRKLGMGKCCLRFRNLDDLLIEPIARSIASTSVDESIRACPWML
ncbi:MAG: hypothetical protein ABI650_00685 [Dokdonella sp.]